jgi:ectoine hydroxylase-related dioxygenase (phytanoyl-CoA dioxygenase family)
VKPTPHAWSRDFVWAAPRGPFRRIDAAQAKSWDEQGYFVLEDAFDAATMERVIAEIDPFEQKSEAFLRKQPGGKLFIARADEITFTTHLVARSPYLREFARHPVFCDLVHDLIGPDVRLYWDQAVYKKPGTRSDFPWHQDNGYTFVEPQAYLTCWVALTDATETNGCPRVVPGLHRGGTLAHAPTDLGLICFDEPPSAPVAAPARAGGIVVFSSLTPHATGPNRTGETRRAYILQYAPDGATALRPGENGAIARERCSAPERQFPVLRDGRPVDIG